ncbi:MAG TPA: hypothetical protein VMU36_08105 [Spirochaetia bacterium]|nr:hypothetical protein [Spirochaetia bacterium]
MKHLFIAVRNFFQKVLDVIRTSRRANLMVGFGAAALVIGALVLTIFLIAGRKDVVRVVATEPKPRPLTENASVPPLTISFSASSAKIELRQA